jgi:hypothetical protein
MYSFFSPLYPLPALPRPPPLSSYSLSSSLLLQSLLLSPPTVSPALSSYSLSCSLLLQSLLLSPPTVHSCLPLRLLAGWGWGIKLN